MERGQVLILGASGFVGRALRQRLDSEGVRVRCGSRSPGRQRATHDLEEWVRADVEGDVGLDEAMSGCTAVVYLVHLMDGGGDLMSRERAAARNALAAAERSGVHRIVYLGGPAPAGEASVHLASRLETGRILRSSPAVSTIELRAAMIVGVGSESWQIVRDLALRLPGMILPSWLNTRSEPVSMTDVTAALTYAIDDAFEGSGWFDLPGPEVLSARQTLERVAAIAGRSPWMVDVPLLTPRLSSQWIRLFSSADYALARKLVDGLSTDLISKDGGYWPRMGEDQRMTFEEAARKALEEEEAQSMAWKRWESFTGWLAATAPGEELVVPPHRDLDSLASSKKLDDQILAADSVPVVEYDGVA